jgi:hypothetical protein
MIHLEEKGSELYNFSLLYLHRNTRFTKGNLALALNLQGGLSNGVSVTIGVVAGSLIRLLAVESGDAPKVGGGEEEGGDPGGEESSEGGVGNDVFNTVTEKKTKEKKKRQGENWKEKEEISEGKDTVFTNVLASRAGTDKVVMIASVLHVDVKASSIDDEQDGACNETTNESPEEQASKLRPAGQSCHQT